MRRPGEWESGVIGLLNAEVSAGTVTLAELRDSHG